MAAGRSGTSHRTSTRVLAKAPRTPAALAFCAVHVWVGTLRISRRVAEKIVRDHGITHLQVRNAVERVAGLDGSWDYSGGRLQVIIQPVIGDDNALVVPLSGG